MSAPSSWRDRLAALDAASQRLASKTESLNQLLVNLQHVSVSGPAAGASSVAVPATPPRGSLQSKQRTYTPHSPASPTGSPFVGAITANAQMARVQQWLRQLDEAVQRADSRSPPSASALDTLARIHGIVLAQQAAPQSQSASVAATPVKQANGSSSGVAEAAKSSPQIPPARAAVQLSPNAASSSAAAPSTRSTLMTITSAGSHSMHGVKTPAGTAFVNGRWIATPVHGAGAAGAQALQDEDADPFADFSDADNSTPATPRRGSVNAADLAAASQGSPARAAAGSVRAKVSLSNSLRRRLDDPLNTADIGEEDVQDLDERADAKGPALVLQDGKWQQAADADGSSDAGAGNAEDEADPFADIDDLEVNLEEEARVRAAELARGNAAAAAAAAAKGVAASPSHQKSNAAIAARAKTLASATVRNKTFTLRAGLSKHMGKDSEIDDGDVAAMDELDDAEAAPAAGEQQQQEDDDDENWDQEEDDPVDEVSAQLESPRAGKLFAPDLSQAKHAGMVTALTTRREGQAQEKDDWPDMDLKREHLRNASLSLSGKGAAEDRPDDLDDLDSEADGDNDAQLSLRVSPNSKSHPLRGGSSVSAAEFSAPVSPASSSVVSRHGASSSIAAREDDDDFSDLDPSRFSGGSLRPPRHSHSISNTSIQSSPSSRTSNHGQLAHAFSDGDDDLDDLSDLMDEDESQQSDVKVDVDNKAAKARATADLHEFDLEPVSPLLHAAEQNRAQFFGRVQLHDLPVLRRPVSPAWLQSLAHSCHPPAAILAQLPHLQPQPEANGRATPPPPAAESQAEAAVTPQKHPASAQASPAGAGNSSSGGGGSQRKKKNKSKRAQ